MRGKSDKSAGASSDLFLGIDVGAVNVRAAVVDGAGQVIHLARERIVRGPVDTVRVVLERVGQVAPLSCIAGAAACGSGRQIYSGQAGWQAYSSPYAVMAGVRMAMAHACTIVQIGGQSAFVIGFEDGPDGPWQLTRSPLCAAGTGRFLEQQASRLGIAIEMFGAQALEWTEQPPRIAARCSVFAKSDLIHLQQKGWPVSAMLAGLADSVARMIRAQWRQPFAPPVAFVGGVAANAGVVRALEGAIEQEVTVPAEFASIEAIGAAMLARSAPIRPHDLYPQATDAAAIYHIHRQLVAEPAADSWRPTALAEAAQPIDVYVGVDVGSTSTKAAVISPDGQVLAKSYLMTAGRPLEALQQVMADLAPQVEGRVRVRGAGVTGSGRYLVGAFIAADLVKNEITAQTRAALHLDPRIDTVFELGGQDAKYVYLENGTALDYQMNKACAAGTGSFIDELAEQLGISTRDGEFARLALSADEQLDLGERCAAFMSQAVTSAQQAGESLPVIVSSLATSLAKNYRSKVVGAKRVGQRVFLTGAVFYNEAVVAAFKAEFPGKAFVVPEHKEVTGAIGAALLARDAEPERPGPSTFRGFTSIVQTKYTLTSFNCRHCENSCAISAMTTDDGRRLYYGSRCDRYDTVEGAASDGKRVRTVETPFDEREALLFAAPGSDDRQSSSTVIGIPRALMAMDLAPLLQGFVEALHAQVRWSSPTNKRTIETSIEHAYSDSCFPIKLLHGHAVELVKAGVDYVLIPNAIRLARMNGDEDQHYACPLVQAAPYIVRSTLDLGDRLLDPIIDLSQGDELTIESLAEVAMRMGHDRALGLAAGRAALARQRAVEGQIREAGRRTLAALAANPDQLGVVLLSRAYNAQDGGANLGIANELAKLGVVPIPLDFMPLDDVDVRQISDRPYWSYERKILAASRIIAEHPRLFGLFLSNFGCGPNSIIQNIVEDIMGGKPLGQIEVDEHAAEAGYITRLEALVDTIRGYHRKGRTSTSSAADYARKVPTVIRAGELVLVVRMDDHAHIVAAAMRHYGVHAAVLPESDERSMALSRDVTSGTECLPFRDTLGVFLRMAEDGEIPSGARALMAGSYGPCRLGKYAQEQQKILDEQGAALTIMTTVSNNAYTDLGLGTRFELLAWRGIVATDCLHRLLWRTRPYECSPGAANRIFEDALEQLTAAIEANRPFDRLMRDATAAFIAARDPALPRRPLIGINGEIYLRANRFCNQDLVVVCEANGLEAEVSPMGEWFGYTGLRNVQDASKNREHSRLIKGELRRLTMSYLQHRIARRFAAGLDKAEPGPQQLLAASSRYLPSRNGSEALLSLGSGLLQMANPHYAGVISVMPHGCMPGGIVAAMSTRISAAYGKPWINLTYDGFADKVNSERVADLSEQVRHSTGG